MANLASPIPMMDPNTNNDSGYAPSNIDGDTKDHTPPPSPIPRDLETKVDEQTEKTSSNDATKNGNAVKKPELK